ncbi:MAG: hypothetical protein LHW56_02160 [Candidatus Cloacimonetes bacterium]|nr:hypothetical protein [Candidatus Cloacimonadota bacterium]MDY0171690.1 hypothetical protein [Candidatus Cloacimonadaceae bacterium]
MKPVSKSVLLTLALVVFSSVAFCQDFPQVIEADSCAQNTFEEGAVDGEKDAMGQGAYLLGGLVFGPLGIMAAAISDPQPDPQKVIMLEQSMGADYVSGYISSFSDVSRKKKFNLRCHRFWDNCCCCRYSGLYSVAGFFQCRLLGFR